MPAVGAVLQGQAARHRSSLDAECMKLLASFCLSSVSPFLLLCEDACCFSLRSSPAARRVFQSNLAIAVLPAVLGPQPQPPRSEESPVIRRVSSYALVLGCILAG